METQKSFFITAINDKADIRAFDIAGNSRSVLDFLNLVKNDIEPYQFNTTTTNFGCQDTTKNF
jgi:hypothetical protein